MVKYYAYVILTLVEIAIASYMIVRGGIKDRCSEKWPMSTFEK